LVMKFRIWRVRRQTFWNCHTWVRLITKFLLMRSTNRYNKKNCRVHWVQVCCTARDENCICKISDIVTYIYYEWCKVHISFQVQDVCVTVQASSADAEWGFILMNNIKTKSHNKLEFTYVEVPMLIKSYLHDGFKVDLDCLFIFEKWQKQTTKMREPDSSSY
jgi:hypothetical protein